MIALIDTIFGPVISWLNQFQAMLSSASVVQGYSLNLGSVFAPIAMISPAWMRLITNIFVMAGVYGIVFIVNNGSGLYQEFKKAIKWW